MRVLYVGGSGRSGSTVLEQLLAGRAGVVAVGELRYVWQRGLLDDQLCSCGTAFRSCPFWRDVFDVAFGGMEHVDGDALVREAAGVDRVRHVPMLASDRLRTPAFRQRRDGLADRLTALYRAIAEVGGAEVVVDSSKDPSYAYVLADLPAVELSLVHLVRDSRAVAYSWTRQRRRPEVHWREEFMRQRPPAVSAREWLVANTLLDALRHRLGERAVRIRYEDFADAPDAVLGAVTDRLDLPRAPAADPFLHSVSGNPLRFDDRPLRIRRDDEWQTALPPRDRRVVTAVTAPLLWRYGYLGGKTS